MKVVCMLVCNALCIASSYAAGGHFDVDDAVLLADGRCQYEVWARRGRTADANTFHAAPTCRVGPVELGLNLDRSRSEGQGERSFGPQVKYVVESAVERVNLGIVATLAYSQRTRSSTQTVYVPLTWFAADNLAINLNAGFDRAPGAGRSARFGVGGEYVLNERFTVLAERIRFLGATTSRVGVRYNLSESLSLDLSTAHQTGLRGPLVTFGISQEFGR